MKQIMLVNDLSGLGNCSLTANLAVFSAMGIQGCGVPTAVLTNQSCYESYAEMPYDVSFQSYAKAWKSANAVFDGIYSGYFRTAAQMADFERAFLDSKGNTPYFNDPVMGDLGTQYDNCSKEMVAAMRGLVSCCALTTPNVTELCLLTKTPYQSLGHYEKKADFFNGIAACAKDLLALGAGCVIVTGVKWKGEFLYNILVDSEGTQFIKTPLLKGDFSGTGDLFSSVVSAGLLNGMSTRDAVKKAAEFIGQAIRFTQKNLKDENDGLYYQPFLKSLAGG